MAEEYAINVFFISHSEAVIESKASESRHRGG